MQRKGVERGGPLYAPCLLTPKQFHHLPPESSTQTHTPAAALSLVRISQATAEPAYVPHDPKKSHEPGVPQSGKQQNL